jgi:hypothetical protein
VAIGTCEVFVYKTCVELQLHVTMAFSTGNLGTDGINIETILAAKE